MKTIKYTTKKGRELAHNYLGAQYENLYQVYGKYSTNKARAEEWCKKTMIQEGGQRFRIISWNTFNFTCGWRNPNGNIRIETAENSYEIINLPF